MEPVSCSLIVLAAGGHASEIRSYVREMTATGQGIDLVGFVDEAKPKGPWLGSRILGGFDDLREMLLAHASTCFRYITAVGSNDTRRTLVERVEKLGLANLEPWTLVHPEARLGRDVTIGEGTCLAPGSIITTRVTVGRHCILNIKSSVSHDCQVGDFSNINPNATLCGDVRIGNGCYIGAGATVIEKISIGAQSIIGAGAVVIADIPANCTAVGVPARVIKRHAPPD